MDPPFFYVWSTLAVRFRFRYAESELGLIERNMKVCPGLGYSNHVCARHCSAGGTLDNIQYVFYHIWPLLLWAQHNQVQFTIKLQMTTLSNLRNHVKHESLQYTSRCAAQVQSKTKQGAKAHRAPTIGRYICSKSWSGRGYKWCHMWESCICVPAL